ncbi:MAG: DUF1080 domain-containing protein [Pirellulaceae bacterium]|nr:DUF1080 domain-containing protein [Pirellulaceae bacterium]
MPRPSRWWLLAACLFAGCGVAGCTPKSDTKTSSTLSSSTNDSKSKPNEPVIDTSIDIEGLMSARLSKKELDFGWIRLFDGQSMMGWQPNSKANWRIENGEIVADAGEKGFLFSTSRFGDFELQLEFLAEPITNSGVFLRCPLTPTSPKSNCYELNIAPPDNPFPTGSLVERIKVNSESVGELDMDQWHTLHALVDGEHVQTWVDGREAVDYQDDTKLTSGLIGLQFREGKIRFRNIRLRPIAYDVIPPKSLDDWKASEGPTFESTFDEGALVMKGGPGHIELMQTLGDFCAQVQVKTLAKNVNSGIFLRCIPGQPMNGYECQIHHGYNKDRRLPADSGMGAIFRRQAARAVLSDEDELAHVTVVADGPHFSTWVEGIQVVDWTDSREADENPRKGLRLEPGTLQLQAHDAECNVRFEALGISPIQ